MKGHEYLNIMTELICVQTETAQIRKNAKYTKIWRLRHLFYRDDLLCDVYAGDREREGEDKVMNDRAKFFNFMFGMMFE